MILLPAALLLLQALLPVALAAAPHDIAALASRHARHARAISSLDARAPAQRCANRTRPKAVAPSAAPKKDPSPAAVAPAKKPDAPKAAAPPPPPAPAPPAAGLIKVASGPCGGNRATKETTNVSGPNGHIDWINCGFETPGGWTPPYVKVSDIVTQPLGSALKNPNSPFKACAKFIWIFEKYGAQFGVPPIILASFAMQESSCRPETVGGGGEQGLMQITNEKCAGAPGGNCRDPEFNIRTAAKFFADTLARLNGNIFEATGAYNGWHRHLTIGKAFAAANSNCCTCQNNGDYLHQFFNGWVQNINAYNSNRRLGKYFNLDKCYGR